MEDWFLLPCPGLVTEAIREFKGWRRICRKSTTIRFVTCMHPVSALQGSNTAGMGTSPDERKPSSSCGLRALFRVDGETYANPRSCKFSSPPMRINLRKRRGINARVLMELLLFNFLHNLVTL